jgi:hypothetical protein
VTQVREQLTARRPSADRLRRFVEEFAEQHPPLTLDSADLTVHKPELVTQRYGAVFDYLTRVELEVERNVLELRTLMPDATEVDRFFYADVWSPQELQHGRLLDALQHELGMPPATPDLELSTRMRVVGLLSHLPGMLGVIRLLYYLTGATTERSAVIAYSRLVDGLQAMGERAIADTVIAPIRRQEPGHFAFYRMSAEALVRDEALSRWQLQLARVLRSRTFSLVGVNNPAQQAAFGTVIRRLGLDEDLPAMARQISLVERELLWSQHQGIHVPTYILTTLQEALTQSKTHPE